MTMKTPKSYSDFTLEHLQTIFGIDNAQKELYLAETDLMPSEWLISALERSKVMPFNSEKAKSEFIISPIILELVSRNPERFRCFSGNTLDVDAKRSLKGRCDFLFTKKLSNHISAPIIAIFEAKDDNVEHWYGQCGSEMLAARIFNEQRNEPIHIIHGAVTSGTEWRFLRLEENVLSIDTELYTVGNLPKLLGALQFLIDFYHT
jgi:hypothetical protein